MVGIRQTIPARVTFLDCAMTPGGTAVLRARCSPSGKTIRFELARHGSFANGAPDQFFVDDVAVARGSDEEERWLQVLRDATRPVVPIANKTPDAPAPKRLMLVPPAIADYFAAIDRGPDEALHSLARYLVAVISSDAYRYSQTPVPPTPPPTLQERIASLLYEGRRLEAMRIYREACPGTSPREAKEAIDAATVSLAQPPMNSGVIEMIAF